MGKGCDAGSNPAGAIIYSLANKFFKQTNIGDFMDNLQLSIWKQEELDIFAPRKKTKKELENERREAINEKLKGRIILSGEEKRKYNFPLIKEELTNTLNYHNQKCETRFLDSQQGMMDAINYHMDVFNPGIPQMLLNSLSQYSEKKQEDLVLSDLVVMYKSICSVLEDDSIKTNNFKKFRKVNNLSFFGYKKFLIMDEYIQSPS